MPTAHIDSFARDHLPPLSEQPEFLFELPALQFPAQLNCATELLDRAIERGWGRRPCVEAAGQRWTYAELLDRANRVAAVLVHEMGLVPGQRVLLRGPNSPMLAACWFGVVSEMPVERLYREIRALRIYEGATEVQQLIIARDLLRETGTPTDAKD